MDTKDSQGKIHFKLRVAMLSLSAFVLSVAVFSRLIVISVKNKNKTDVVKPENSQVLSYEDENVQVDEKKLPDVFPSDIPVYPGAFLEDYWVSDSEQVTGVSVVWSSDNSLEDVVNFYKEKITPEDFGGQVVLDDGNSLTMSFARPDYDGFVGVTSDGSSTVISLTVGIKDASL